MKTTLENIQNLVETFTDAKVAESWTSRHNEIVVIGVSHRHLFALETKLRVLLGASKKDTFSVQSQDTGFKVIGMEENIVVRIPR